MGFLISLIYSSLRVFWHSSWKLFGHGSMSFSCSFRSRNVPGESYRFRLSLLFLSLLTVLAAVVVGIVWLLFEFRPAYRYWVVLFTYLDPFFGNNSVFFIKNLINVQPLFGKNRFFDIFWHTRSTQMPLSRYECGSVPVVFCFGAIVCFSDWKHQKRNFAPCIFTGTIIKVLMQKNINSTKKLIINIYLLNWPCFHLMFNWGENYFIGKL